MHSRDLRDLISGLAIALAGLGIALYAASNYPLGTLRRMGSGMFPTAIGVSMVALGALIAIPACFRSGEDLSKPDMKSAAPILASIVAFAIIQPLAGLVPAIFSLVLISSLAARRLRFRSALLLSAALSLLAYALFVELLDTPMVMIRGVL